jgi:OmpA-OmpF porin, OOP family
MAENLLDSLKSYITPDLISKASSMLGESEGGVQKGMAAIVPTLLSGLVNKSGDSGVMGSVMNLISDNKSNSEGILSNVSGLLSNDSPATGIGSNFLGMLFGDKQSGIGNLISSVSGIKGSSATSLMGMAAPLLLSHFGKSGTTLSGLTSMLSSQKESILSAAPAGLGSLAGFANNFGSDVKSTINKNIPTPPTGGGLPKWLLPLLLIGAAIAALYFFSRSCEKKAIDTSAVTNVLDSAKANLDSAKTDIASAVDSASVKVTDAASALGKFFKFKLPNGVELNAPELGIENKLVTWIADETKMVDKTTWFNFDRLLFETGSSKLQPASQEQLKNMAEIMKAYPNLEIKLGGYTDNTGVAATNLKLSGDRANSVKAELVTLGIDGKRITAEGFGDQYPVASNDTEEGRAKNRRIGVRVTKK